MKTETEANGTPAREALREIGMTGAGESAREGASRLLDRVTFFGLLVLIVLAPVPYGTVEPWWESRFECAVFALTALWVIEGLLRGSWRASRHTLLLPLLVLVVFAFIQTLPLWGASQAAGVEGTAWRAVSADPYETQRFAFKLLALTLTGMLLLCYTSSQRRFSALIHVVISVGVASAIFGIVRQTTQRGEAGFILPYLMPGEGYAQFINRNHFAFLMEMTLGLVLGLVVGGGVRRDRVLIYLGAVVPVWTALVLSNSRGGIFSMLSQVVFLALPFGAAWPQRGYPGSRGLPEWLGRIARSLAARALLIAGLVMVVAVGIVWMGGDPLVSRLESMPVEISAEGAKERGGEPRAELWRATWQLIKAHPVAGVGFGGYWVAIPEYHDASGEETPQQAHNDYLELLASGGIIGGALVAWFVIAMIKIARERLRTTDPFRRAACFGALAGLIGIAVHSLVDFGLHITANALTFTALAVIATLDGRVEGQRSRRSELPSERPSTIAPSEFTQSRSNERAN